MPIITAYRIDTGQPVSIPKHWLGHPKLGAPFCATPVEVTSTFDADDQYETYDQYENPEEGDTNAIHSL